MKPIIRGMVVREETAVLGENLSVLLCPTKISDLLIY